MTAAKTVAFNVLNRWTGAIQFTAQIECADDTPLRIKVGLALKWAFARGAVLRGAVLRDADLRGAVLRDAVLRDADLRGADLRGAVLRDAVLSGADLRGADLRGAVLRDADLRDADLRDADLRDADLRDADLRGAVLSGADIIFAGIDSRGYEFYLTANKATRAVIIRAGCRRWVTFAKARAHFTQGYTSNGIVPEVLAKLNLLETVARARGYLGAATAEAA